MKRYVSMLYLIYDYWLLHGMNNEMCFYGRLLQICLNTSLSVLDIKVMNYFSRSPQKNFQDAMIPSHD